MPRRPITGKLVRGKVWQRREGRRWIYQHPKLLRSGAKCRSRLGGFEHPEYSKIPVQMN